MPKSMIATLILLLNVLVVLGAQAHTAKTNHTDVNLWSAPGREYSERIGKIEKNEEVEVLSSKVLENGQRWLKIHVRRSPGWRHHGNTGWVDAKFFRSINAPSSEDESIEAVSQSSCVECLNQQTPGLKKYKNAAGVFNQLAKSKNIPSGEFIWPVTGVIKSGFGMRRHPILGVTKLHNGTDIAGNKGKAVHASKSGKIISSRGGCQSGSKRCNGGSGNMIIIDHGDGTQTKYLHLSSSCPLTRKGTRVDQGDIIACVGSTGASTGPHLHFSVSVNGKYINPLKVLPRRNI